MSEITTIGLDLAKHVFQVHGIDAEGTTVLRKRLRRNQVLGFFSRLPRCVVGLEACATAQYWARELGAMGHEVRLMSAQYVKAYVKRNKNDAADAEAICEAVQRPTMRFVAVKTAEQQAAQLLHRGREQLVRQRTMLVNALRAHMAEFGIIAAQGLHNVGQLIAIVRDDGDTRLPDVARQVLEVLANQIEQIETAVPTANPKRLTATANRLILAPDERSLQIDLVRLDRTVPVADCVGSRDPCPSTPTQRAAAQIPEAIGLQQR